jgi:hypothetical protein
MTRRVAAETAMTGLGFHPEPVYLQHHPQYINNNTPRHHHRQRQKARILRSDAHCVIQDTKET